VLSLAPIWLTFSPLIYATTINAEYWTSQRWTVRWHNIGTCEWDRRTANESVPKIIINDTKIFPINCNQHNSFPVLFDKIVSVYFIWKTLEMTSPGNRHCASCIGTLSFLINTEMWYKKLSYRRGTARCVVSVVILPVVTQQCRNCLYHMSRTKYQLSLIDPCDKIVL